MPPVTGRLFVSSLSVSEKMLLSANLSSRNYCSGDIKKKNPDSKVGGPNQKPLTIKPYPMKIQG